MKSQNKIYYNQNHIDSMINQLAKDIGSKHKIDFIIGIETGGLYISKPLAQILNIPHTSIKISFYGDSKTPNSKPVVNDHGLKWNKNDHYLFVDDLIDSGSTFNYIPKLIKSKNYSTAVLFHKKDNKFKIEPTYWVTEKPDIWIEFYWDKNKQLIFEEVYVLLHNMQKFQDKMS